MMRGKFNQKSGGLPLMPLNIGEHIGQYEITAEIGAGGMASVYQAYHARLDRFVAIKVMHPNMTNDPGFRARFEREARIVARLEHPNIVSVYDFDEYKNQPYLVMRYVEGETLKDRLREGKLDTAESLILMSQLAVALSYAHRQGVLHRDLKPSNVIIDDDGIPYLTDFGLARIAGAGESTMSADVMLGTPQYISPEQAKGGTDLDARTDVYSFGIMLYELLTGRVPYRGDTPYSIVHDQIYTPLPAPRSINPDIPEAAEKVLIKALAKQPADRYDSPTALMNDLKRAYAGEVVSAEVPDSQSAPATNASIASPIPDDDAANLMTRKDYKRRKRVIRTQLKEDVLSRREYQKQRRELKSTFKEDKKTAEEIKEAEEDANLTPEERLRRQVERRIKKRREEFFGLVTHIFWYLVINVWLFNLDGWVSQIVNGQGLLPQGAQWISFFWGIGVVSHILSYYFEHGPGARSREATIQREYEREYARIYGERPSQVESQVKIKNEDLFLNEDDKPSTGKIRLTGDGEFTDSYIAELRDDEPNYNEK